MMHPFAFIFTSRISRDDVVSGRTLGRGLRAWVLIAALVTPGVGTAAPAARIDAYFEPLQGEHAALSRDGRLLALVSTTGPRTRIAIASVDEPGWRGDVVLDVSASDISFFDWATPDLLVLASGRGVLHVVDARLGIVRMKVDAESFRQAGEALRPPRFIGLLPGEPGQALVERVSPFVSGGGVPGEEIEAAEAQLAVFQVQKLDLQTGEWKELTSVIAHKDSALLYDRQGYPRILKDRAWIPQKLRYRSAGRMPGRWKDLDAWLESSTPSEFRVTPQNYLGRHSYPLGFSAGGDVLYFASNVGGETHGIFQLDLHTKARTEVASDAGGFDLAHPDQALSDGPLIFDRREGRLVGVRNQDLQRRTRWLDPELAQVQALLECKLPGRDVQVWQWDNARARFLILAGTDADPGRWFVFHRGDGRLVGYLRRAPALSLDRRQPVTTFVVQAPSGMRLVGRITLPRSPRVKVPPLIVRCHAGPTERWVAGFDREGQALAAMGFLVLQIAYRGSTGLGWRHCEVAPEAWDGVPLEDVRAAMQWLAGHHQFDARRVAIIGEGFGGYLALRALTLHPEAFRCAIAMNAPVDLEQMRERPREQVARELKQFSTDVRTFFRDLTAFGGGAGAEGGEEPRRMPTLPMPKAFPAVDFRAELDRWIFTRNRFRAPAPSVKNGWERVTQPVLLIHDRNHPRFAYEPVRALQQALRHLDFKPELLPVSSGFTRGDLAARAAVYEQIQGFLNAALYEYQVKIGEPEVVEERHP